MNALSIIVPVYNEKENINNFVNTLENNVITNHELIIVYDKKNDNTIANVKKLQKKYKNIILTKNSKKGAKYAFLTGLKKSKFQFILIAFPDELLFLYKIDEMFKKIIRGYDMVSGTRYKNNGNRYGGNLIGKILSKYANFFMHYILKYPLSDITTGFKMFRKEIFNEINIENKKIDWSFIVEITIKIIKKNYRICEIPVISIDRPFGGISKGSIFCSFKSYFHSAYKN